MNLVEKIDSIFPAAGQIPAEFDIARPVEQRSYLIDGELRTWQGSMQEILSPIHTVENGQPVQRLIGRAPELDKDTALEALQAAVAAYDRGQGKWPTMSVAGRIEHIEKFTRLMVERRDDVVRYIMWEIGKSLADSRKEFDRTVKYIEDTIDALKEQDRAAARFIIEQGIIGHIRRSPLGVVLCMGPYNYPLNETFATLIPALIMGNTCVFKPPKMGVLLYEPLLAAFRDALPPGVLNTVYGEGEEVIAPIMASGQIDVLAFIGSSRVADILKKKHPHPHRLRGVLGMGAKNAAIVLPDADIDLAVQECLLGSLSYNGQRCTALKILFVHDSIVGAFLEKYKQGLAELPFGMPWDDKVQITPLPEPGKSEYLDGLVADARAHGAEVVNEGGGRSNKSFYYPALLYPVNEKMRVYNEEQFGPVVPVVPFVEMDRPIKYIHESPFGQQVSIFGTDPNVLSVLVDPMVNQVSRVNLNSQCQRGPDTFPFTGRKGSAEGTLSVSDALRQFSIRTLVAAKENGTNKTILTEIVRDHKSNFLSTDFIF